ncbi:ABC transporter ATP-binding protein [Desertimonas flava]|uniref:ABC transporter ATP-binding protein n=1 Tax=Desertimonas flava TaxID=2064846 RepID=UPI000E349DDF|nr:ABC transporter ATP-binding protein [Desertimonas flava]
MTASNNAGPGPLLEVRDYRTHFRTRAGAITAVDGVDLTIDRGETLGIVGESGSGKTVLARSIMGLLDGPGVVRDGSVRFKGVELVGGRRDDLQRVLGTEMAMIFQDPLTALNPVVRIGRQLTEGLRIRLGRSSRQARDLAVELIRAVGISEPERRLQQYPHELSGGMRQRIVIAIALSCGPELLFADEPTTALDVTVQAQILNLLADEQAKRRMAMVMITHDLGVMAGRSDRIAVMYAGQVVEQAPTPELFANVRMPYTEALLAAIPRMEGETHVRLRSIAGRPPNLGAMPPGCRFAPRCQYARHRCSTEPPPLVVDETTAHAYRCWYPLDEPQRRDGASAAGLGAGGAVAGRLGQPTGAA